MFTKDQLNQLREVIREENEPIKKAQESLQADVSTIKDVQQEHSAILKDHTRRLRGLKMVLTRVRRDVSYIGKTYNEEIVDNRRRIEQLEEKARLTNPNKN